MTDSKKNVEELNQVISAGMSWLQKYGIISSVSHNNIVLNIYSAFPKVRYLEYFLPEDTSRRKVWIVLYVPLWKLIFINRERMVDDVVDFLREYLDNYDIHVQLRRYKKGVEKVNEVPTDAIAHINTAQSTTGDSESSDQKS